MSYREMLQDPRWQRKRLEVLQRDDFTCRLCAARDKSLQVHHTRYERGHAPWEYDPRYLITLCVTCHECLTFNRYGEQLVEVLLEGGARHTDIMAVLLTLDVIFTDGRDGQQLNEDELARFRKGLRDLAAPFLKDEFADAFDRAFKRRLGAS